MAKITIDRLKFTYLQAALQVSDEEDERVYRIARKAFDLFEEARWDDGLEVIKCTLRRQHLFSVREGDSKAFLVVSFQLPITPPHFHGVETEFSKENRLVIRVEWSGNHENRLRAYLEEKSVGNDIMLEDTEDETVAKGLVQAVRQAVENRQQRLNSIEEWLERRAQRLASVLEQKEAA